MNREIAILQLMLTPGLGARSIARLLRRLESAQLPLTDFVSLPPAQLTNEYSLSPVSAEALRHTAEEARQLADTLTEHRIQIVTLTDTAYPSLLAQRLERTAPPLLFARGDSDLLTRPMIAFAGARDCSETGLTLARELASALARDGANIVSGHAPGIDTAAHFGALSSGGVTTAVLASGILHFAPRSDLAAFSDETNTLIISEFFPAMPWKSHSAMQRNKTICGMARGMVIVESGESGGTFAAGKAALEIGCPLYVIDWPGPPPSAAGNRELIRRGGIPLSSNDTLPENLLARLLAEPASSGTPDLFS